MSRKEFMERLEELLMDIPESERDEALTYYSGYFEDAGVENEETIIRELESPEKVAEIIKADMDVEDKNDASDALDTVRQSEEKADVEEKDKKKKRSLSTGGIVLLVLAAVFTSPLWIGILGSAVGLILGFFGAVLGILVALAAAVLSFYAVGIAIGGAGIASLAAGKAAAGIGLLGTAFLVLALAVLGTVGCAYLYGRFLPWMVRGIIGMCRRSSKRKEQAA